jgi:hypothetical protein
MYLIREVQADAGHEDYHDDEQAMEICRFVLLRPPRHEIPFPHILKGGMARN